MSTERFDIEAKMPDGASKDDAPAMLRTLLEERFRLRRTKKSKTTKCSRFWMRKAALN